MTRILLDQGLPQSTATFLRQAGWDITHVLDIGMSRATDIEIIARARNDDRTICTLDADFHALIAIAEQDGPSVIRIRQEGLRGEELSNLLLSIWPRIASSVAKGALITVTDKAVRVRELPIARTND